ncbi:lipocalin family protein [Hoylesella loescheii]|jgi:hypothetical protein|uniref:Lipocalin-like domain-containing protein n=1 Tax=Hoylesella loescheii DSM 19665 = JCM 12249 = ATCC 15930 TaxID=1122985 RepID=A0A069QEG3_HOYLO|nr:lipocalin family protein [Hoylesella loescheii]KDR51160.1 hypothetical protein HMPREF1991_02790 [Hoylesella loescheii DSM 19665 = JCM 12249 = ATCC 15930]
MKSTILKNHILHFAAMFVVLIAGLSFVSCASESGEDQEASPIVDTWMSQGSSTGIYYMVFTEYKQYFVTTDLKDPNKNSEIGSYSFANNKLTCNPKGKSQKVYNCVITGSRMRLTPSSGNEGVKEFIRYTPSSAAKRVTHVQP